MKRTLSVLLIVASALMGCGEDNCPTLSGGIAYCLQPPATGPMLSALQQVSIQWGERREVLLARIENGPGGLVFVGLTPLGQTVLVLTWDGDRVRATWPPATRPPIEPAVLVALLQIALWPVEAIRPGLPAVVVMEESGSERRLARDARTLLSVRRTDQEAPYNSFAIELPAAGLSVRVTALADETGGLIGVTE